jgi:uracil-DNA glycosylase
VVSDRGKPSSRRTGTRSADLEIRTRSAGPQLSRLLPHPEAALQRAQAAIIACERCPRLRQYCQRVGREKRRAFRDDTYWAKPVPGFGDPAAQLLILGLAPAAHGANRTGRVFTGDGIGASGDFLMTALHRAGFANLTTSRDPDDCMLMTFAFIASAFRCAPQANYPSHD